MGVSMSLSVSEVKDSSDIISNTSKIKVVLKATTTNGSYNFNSPSGSITIDNVKYTYSKDLPKNDTVTLYSATKVIKHNEDGSKDVEVSYVFNTGISAGSLSGSKSITLEKINRGVRIKVEGEYKRAVVYIKEEGEYKQSIPYVKEEGKYRLATG